MCWLGLCFVIFMTIGPRRSVVGTIGKGIFGWVSADAAGGGEEHRQHVCHKQGVHAQEEGTGEAHSAVHERRIMAAVSFLFLVQLELA